MDFSRGASTQILGRGSHLVVTDSYRHLGFWYEVWTRRWGTVGYRVDLLASGLAQDPAGSGLGLGESHLVGSCISKLLDAAKYYFHFSKDKKTLSTDPLPYPI